MCHQLRKLVQERLQRGSGEFHGFHSGQNWISAKLEVKPEHKEEQPLMPVARRSTARMGFPARPTRLGYQISKCEECDLHFADDTMQRHMATGE